MISVKERIESLNKNSKSSSVVPSTYSAQSRNTVQNANTTSTNLLTAASGNKQPPSLSTTAPLNTNLKSEAVSLKSPVSDNPGEISKTEGGNTGTKNIPSSSQETTAVVNEGISANQARKRFEQLAKSKQTNPSNLTAPTRTSSTVQIKKQTTLSASKNIVMPNNAVRATVSESTAQVISGRPYPNYSIGDELTVKPSDPDPLPINLITVRATTVANPFSKPADPISQLHMTFKPSKQEQVNKEKDLSHKKEQIQSNIDVAPIVRPSDRNNIQNKLIFQTLETIMGGGGVPLPKKSVLIDHQNKNIVQQSRIPVVCSGQTENIPQGASGTSQIIGDSSIHQRSMDLIDRFFNQMPNVPKPVVPEVAVRLISRILGWETEEKIEKGSGITVESTQPSIVQHEVSEVVNRKKKKKKLQEFQDD